jgi:hypothetical protein
MGREARQLGSRPCLLSCPASQGVRLHLASSPLEPPVSGIRQRKGSQHGYAHPRASGPQSCRPWARAARVEGRSQRAGGGGATGFVKGRSRACRWGVPTPPLDRPVERRTCLTVAASREEERRKTHYSTAEEAVKDESGDED